MPTQIRANIAAAQAVGRCSRLQQGPVGASSALRPRVWIGAVVQAAAAAMIVAVVAVIVAVAMAVVAAVAKAEDIAFVT